MMGDHKELCICRDDDEGYHMFIRKEKEIDEDDQIIKYDKLKYRIFNSKIYKFMFGKIIISLKLYYDNDKINLLYIIDVKARSRIKCNLIGYEQDNHEIATLLHIHSLS
jgi:hypothetical protein